MAIGCLAPRAGCAPPLVMDLGRGVHMTHPDPVVRLLARSVREDALPDACPISVLGELKTVRKNWVLLARYLPDEVRGS